MSVIRPGFGPADVMALRSQVLARSAALQDVRAASDAPRAAGPAPSPAAGFADTLGNALKQVNAVQQRSSDMQVAYERGQVTDIAQVMLARQTGSQQFERRTGGDDATAAQAIFQFPVETIGSKFGGIPRDIPPIALPSLSLSTLNQLIQPAAGAISTGPDRLDGE